MVSNSFHKTLNKKSRCLSEKQIDVLIRTELYRNLQECFGNIVISDEHLWGFPEAYIRIVRPYCKGDVGPLHRDGDFWKLHPEWSRPLNCGDNRLKVWISINLAESGEGLGVVPGSHKFDLDYSSEVRNGETKPILKTSQELEMLVQCPIEQAGSFMVFDDSLVHGGRITKGCQSRISLEFTLFTHSEV